MRIGIVLAVGLLAFSFKDMPTLTWMGDENVRRTTKDVVTKILIENKTFSYCQTGLTGFTGLECDNARRARNVWE